MVTLLCSVMWVEVLMLGQETVYSCWDFCGLFWSSWHIPSDSIL